MLCCFVFFYIMLQLRNKSGRAVPVRHVVMGDELQQIVDNLQPTDNIDDHVIYRALKGK